MNFPVIHHIDDVLPFIENRPEFIVKTHANNFKTICYNISNNETFDNAVVRECRGITFDDKGNIVCRPLHKFFNVGEREDTFVQNIDWTQVNAVHNKLDGSMITPMLINNEIVSKTKLSFETEQATNATAFIKSKPGYTSFVRYCHTIGVTPIFEWTSPKNRIVLKYTDDNLILLQMRKIITGEYFSKHELSRVAKLFKVDYAETEQFTTIEALLELIKNQELKEGSIVQFNSGDMVKIKSPWYLDLHRTVTFTRERDVVELILNETIDDFKGYLTSIGESLDKVIALENGVVHTFNTMKSVVEEFCVTHKDLPRKEFFAKTQENDLTAAYAPLIMQHMDGKEPNYREYFKRNILKKYSLDPI